MRTIQAALVERVAALNLRLYSSLPWGYRVAQLLVKLATYDLEPWTRAVYAEFVASGIEGLPDVNGEPVGKLGIKGARDLRKLPKGYGGVGRTALGPRAYQIVMKLTGSMQDADDLLGSFLTEKVFTGKLSLKEGFSVKQAESYVLTGVQRMALDLLRKKKRRPENTMLDEEGKLLDFNDPDAFKEFDHIIPQGEMHRILQELARIDPRAPQWLEYMMQDRAKGDLAKAWQKHPAEVSHFEKKYLPAIRKVLQQHLSPV